MGHDFPQKECSSSQVLKVYIIAHDAQVRKEGGEPCTSLGTLESGALRGRRSWGRTGEHAHPLFPNAMP